MTNTNLATHTNLYPFPTKTTSTTTRTSSTTRAREDFERMINLAIECLGINPTPWILRQISEWIEATSPDLTEYAITQAAMAPAPSMRYAAAIIKRLIAEGAQTINDVRKKPTAPTRRGKVVREQQYTQREYMHTEEELDRFMAEWDND